MIEMRIFMIERKKRQEKKINRCARNRNEDKKNQRNKIR